MSTVHDCLRAECLIKQKCYCSSTCCFFLMLVYLLVQAHDEWTFKAFLDYVYINLKLYTTSLQPMLSTSTTHLIYTNTKAWTPFSMFTNLHAWTYRWQAIHMSLKKWTPITIITILWETFQVKMCQFIKDILQEWYWYDIFLKDNSNGIIREEYNINNAKALLSKSYKRTF